MERKELLKKVISFSEAIENEDNNIRMAPGMDGPYDPFNDISDTAAEYCSADRPQYQEFLKFLDTLPDFDIVFTATLAYAELYEEDSFEDLFYYMKCFEREGLIKNLSRKFPLTSSQMDGIKSLLEKAQSLPTN